MKVVISLSKRVSRKTFLFSLLMYGLLGGLKAAAPIDFSPIVAPLLPAVVNISTTVEVKREGQQDMTSNIPSGSLLEELLRPFLEGGQSPDRSSLGSGFIIAQEGETAFIVTCNHLIAEADEIKVTLHDDTELNAEVVGRDKRTDIALLKVKTNKKLTVVGWADSNKVEVGQWSIAIGNPFGLSSTVTVGIISTIARDISSRAQNVLPDYVGGYIQTDAPINPGNSGGPMFNVEGKVIAVTTAIYSPTGGNIGIGFGIPANLAQKVVEQLKQFGRTKRGWIGVQIQRVTPDIAESLGLKEPLGALVGDVTREGPAAKAGIRRGDVILKVNDKEIKKSSQLPRIVGETQIGTTIPIEVWRNSQTVALRVKVGEFEQAEKEGLIGGSEISSPEKLEKAEVVLGLAAKEITPILRERYAIPEEVKGVFVTYVDPASEAATKIRSGYIIQQMTAENLEIEPTKPEDLKKFVENARKAGKKKVRLLINNGGNLRYVALSLDDKAFKGRSKKNF